MTVAVENLIKMFGEFTALNDVSLAAREGEFLALLGPSGSGKTTLLRIMAGLEFPDAGIVRFDGEDVSTRPTGERRVGFVFQHYALFRHMTVAKNVAFGLEVKPSPARPAKAAILARVERVARSGAVRPFGRALSRAALGRAAPARRVGARVGGRSAHPAARRALRRAWTPRSARNCGAGCDRCTRRWG